MAIGRHTAAAVQNIGGIVGGAMEKSTLLQAQQQEEQRKEAQRQAERAEDREWEREKFSIQQESAVAKEQRAERRHQETLAAAKQRNLDNIRSREKIAADKLAASSEGGNEYKIHQQLDDLRADIRTQQERLTDPYNMTDEELKAARNKLARLEREYDRVYRQAAGKPDPELPGDIRFDKGLVGRGMGAFRPGQTPPPAAEAPTAVSDNRPGVSDNEGGNLPRVNSIEEFYALPPGTIAVMPDGSKKRVPMTR